MAKYDFLRKARLLFKILAWVALGIGIVVGLIIIIAGPNMQATLPDGTPAPGTPRAMGLVFMLMGAVYFLILLTISEVVGLLLEIKDSCSKESI